MLRRHAIRIMALAGFAAIALLSGCKDNLQVTSIKTLLDDPARFDKQTVRIAGEVTKSLGILGLGAYQVDDGTGGIAVVTKEGGAPRQGAQVGVEGEFRAGYTLGTETAAVILEKQRYTP